MLVSDANAVVYFWDGSLFSPGVVLPEIGKGLKRHLHDFLKWLEEDEDWSRYAKPGALAADLVIYSAGVDDAGRVTLRNAPTAPSTGGVMTRMHQEIVGGAGTVLVNLITREVQQWGGYGIYPEEGFNAREVRTVQLGEIEKLVDSDMVLEVPTIGGKKGGSKKKGGRQRVDTNS